MGAGWSPRGYGLTGALADQPGSEERANARFWVCRYVPPCFWPRRCGARPAKSAASADLEFANSLRAGQGSVYGGSCSSDVRVWCARPRPLSTREGVRLGGLRFCHRPVCRQLPRRRASINSATRPAGGRGGRSCLGSPEPACRRLVPQVRQTRGAHGASPQCACRQAPHTCCSSAITGSTW